MKKKNVFYKKRYYFVTNRNKFFENWQDSFDAILQHVSKFEARIFWTAEVNASNILIIGPGWADSSRISIECSERKFHCSWIHTKQNISYWEIVLFENPSMTVERSLRRRVRFDSLRVTRI